MGSASSCSCFEGLLSGGGSRNQPNTLALVPDASPQRFQRRQVKSLDEAIQIARPRVGSWTSPCPASPYADRIVGGRATALSQMSEFELVIEEKSPSSRHRGPSGVHTPSAAMLVDPDGFKRSVSGRNTGPLSPKHSPIADRHFLMEQLVASPGRLPPPLQPSVRERILRELQPTATFEMLSQIPKHLLEASGEEAQELRRRVLNGATIVFFTAGYPGKRFIFERARELGVKSVVIDHPDSWSKGMVEEGVIAKFIAVDMAQEPEAVYKQSLAAVKDLANDEKTRDADGVATFVELSVPVVARLAEELGLPGHTPLAVDIARDKHRTRAAMKAAGLPSPKNMLLSSATQLPEGGKAVGFPAVLKPVSGAASLGVKKVSSMQELREGYEEVLAELQSLVVSSGALVKADPSGAGVQADKAVDLTILMEQYLDGAEVDVDVVMSQGEWRYAAVADNGPTMEPYFNETWAVCPSLLPSKQQKVLKELAISAVKCLGFTDGAFHVECKMTSHGPHLIEVNARMGGGQVHETNLRVWGVDLVEETLFAAAGVPSRPYIPTKEKTVGGAVAYAYVNASKSGVLQDLKYIDPLKGREGIVWAKPLVAAGEQVVGPQDGMPTWLVDIMVQKPEPKEALDFLFALQEVAKPTIN